MNDTAIVDNIHAFLAHHRTIGQRPKDEQNAIDAVLTACCFDSN